MGVYLAGAVLYVITQSWQIAVLTVAVAAATFVLRHRSAHVRYLLWLIVVVKCFVPPLHTVALQVLPGPAPEGLPAVLLQPPWSLDRAAVMDLFGRPMPVQKLPLPATVPQPDTRHVVVVTVPRPWPVWGAMVTFWLTGAGAYLTMNLLRALRGHHWLQENRRPLPDDARADATNLLRAYDARRLPRIWIVEGVGQPFVWGLLRGSIYVPPGFLTIKSPEHRRDVLAHELSHVLRFDAAVNVLQVIAQGLFWFHPFVWWANRKIRQERENCCDEMVIARLHTTPKDYSTAIVETLARARESTRPVPSLAVASPLKHIEERIKTVLRPGRRFYRRPSLVIAALVILVALVTVPTAVVLTAQSKHLVSGMIRIAPTEPSIWDPEPKPFDRDAYATSMRTQAVLLLNGSVVLDVADDLAGRGLTFSSSPSKSASREPGPQGVDRFLRQAIAKGIIKAAPVPDTELLEVTMVSENEEEARTIVNSFLQHYVAACRAHEAAEMGQSLQALHATLQEIDMRIKETRRISPTTNEGDATGTDSIKVANPDQSLQLKLKLNEELYEKISRRLQELEIGRQQSPWVNIGAPAEVKGMADNRRQ